jgi:hypothetical protein
MVDRRKAPRAVKRSVTIRPEIDQAVVRSVGEREYSRFTNDALLMALQARGVAETIAEFEAAHGPLTESDHADAERRHVEAVARAEARVKSLPKAGGIS